MPSLFPTLSCALHSPLLCVVSFGLLSFAPTDIYPGLFADNSGLNSKGQAKQEFDEQDKRCSSNLIVCILLSPLPFLILGSDRGILQSLFVQRGHPPSTTAFDNDSNNEFEGDTEDEAFWAETDFTNITPPAPGIPNRLEQQRPSRSGNIAYVIFGGDEPGIFLNW